MNLEQLRAQLAKIAAQIESFAGIEGEYNDEQCEQINALHEDFAKIKKQIEAAEKVEALTAQSKTSARKVATTPTVEVTRNSKEELQAGFKSYGEFLAAVKDASVGKIDRRFQNTHFEKNGEDGGFLVPETFMSEVKKKTDSDESLLAKTSQIVISSNNMTLPIDEQAPWNGGIQAYWINEGGQYTESKLALAQASWRLHKLGALVKVTDELLEDATALESYMLAKAPEAIMHKINGAIISGNGVGKPMGILSSGFKVQVAKEAGQTADTVVARNVIKMYSRMLPSSRASAVWYINPMVEEQLLTLKDDNGNFIYLAPGSQMNQTPYGQLLGRPVLPLLGGMPQLGDEGDIIFADLKYYTSILKAGGIKQAVSAHLLFDRDIQCYKFVMRIDGSCPFKSPVSPEFGTYEMSGIVTLAERA